eukprot:12904875-Heterocapsa_arctica.AAC.1
MVIVSDTPIHNTRARTAMRSNVVNVARAIGAIREVPIMEAARRYVSRPRRRGPQMNNIVLSNHFWMHVWIPSPVSPVQGTGRR